MMGPGRDSVSVAAQSRQARRVESRPIALSIEGKHYRSFFPLAANIDSTTANPAIIVQCIRIFGSFQKIDCCLAGSFAAPWPSSPACGSDRRSAIPQRRVERNGEAYCTRRGFTSLELP